MKFSDITNVSEAANSFNWKMSRTERLEYAISFTAVQKLTTLIKSGQVAGVSQKQNEYAIKLINTALEAAQLNYVSYTFEYMKKGNTAEEAMKIAQASTFNVLYKKISKKTAGQIIENLK